MTTKDYRKNFEAEYNTIKNCQDIPDEEYNKYMSEYRRACKGCMNEGWKYCDDASIIDCYLHRTLPNGVWSRAMLNRRTNKCVDEITKTINNKILDNIKNGSTN